MSAATVETWEPGTPLYAEPDQGDLFEDTGQQFIRPIFEALPGDDELVLDRLGLSRWFEGVCFRCEVTWGDPKAACWCCGNPGQVTR